METNTLLFEKTGAVARLTLNRPQARNAVNGDLCRRLQECLTEVERDDRVKAVVLAGKGPIFSAGGDLNSIEKMCDDSAGRNYVSLTETFGAVEQLYNCSKPTISAVHGAVVGGACGLVAACDFVYAEETTRFIFPFLDLGIIPDMCVMFVLTQRVGLQAARRLLLQVQTITAGEASNLGLVDHLSAEGKLMDEALTAAENLAKRSGPAMAFTKSHLNRIGRLSFAESMQQEVLQQSLLWTTPEVKQRAREMLQQLATKKK
ncbi:MAG: enoyl-CoA hydratase/isomerase family protein [bacterium]